MHGKGLIGMRGPSDSWVALILAPLAPNAARPSLLDVLLLFFHPPRLLRASSFPSLLTPPPHNPHHTHSLFPSRLTRCMYFAGASSSARQGPLHSLDERLAKMEPCRRLSSHHTIASQGDYQAGWAILGSANIAHKLWKAIHMSGNSRVVCVASREFSRAEAFIDECQAQLPFAEAPEAVEGYDAALERDDVHVVYIPLPTALRKEWVLKAAKAGKHVLVEKPVGLTTEDVQEMIRACIKHNVHLMDGVMFMHSARLPLLHHTLPSLGALKRINTEFCFKADEAFFKSNIRCSSATEPLGCLGDLGWYNIRFTLWALNLFLPVRARGHLHAQNEEGVPYEFSGELLFENGCSATFFCSFLTHETQLAVINGERGSIQVKDFVLPLPGRYLSFDVNRQSYQHEGLDQVVHSYTERLHAPEAAYGHPSSQEACMIRHLSDLSREGGGETTKWPEQILKTQMVLDAVLLSARERDGGWVEMEGGK